MKTGSILAVIIFSLVAAAHLLRLILGVSVTIDDWVVPQWPSILGVIVPGLIAWKLMQEAK